MNKYEVLGVVGEGAYGVVLKWQNKETGDLVLFCQILDLFQIFGLDFALDFSFLQISFQDLGIILGLALDFILDLSQNSIAFQVCLYVSLVNKPWAALDHSNKPLISLFLSIFERMGFVCVKLLDFRFYLDSIQILFIFSSY